MNQILTSPPLPALPAHGAPWHAWRDYGLAYARLWSDRSPHDLTARWTPTDPVPGVIGQSAIPCARTMTMYAYREERPGPRWLALYNATWAAYRQWYTHQGLAARPSLAECRVALRRHMPELLPIWERLSELTKEDPLAARMLAMWRLPAFAVGCAQTVLPGERPVLVRNYDYDQALFEGVIASTNYSGQRRVIGTSDMLWGLLDGMNEDGLAVSLTYGGRPGRGSEGFGIPLVLRYLLETCGTVREAVAALRRIPVALSYNVALADTHSDHATVFVAPGETAKVSRIKATTNHCLDTVEYPERAARFNSLGRQEALLTLHREGAGADDTIAAMLTAPLRSLEFDAGFGTLYTASYDQAAGTANWHWPGESWSRSYDDPDAERTVVLTK